MNAEEEVKFYAQTAFNNDIPLQERYEAARLLKLIKIPKWKRRVIVSRFFSGGNADGKRIN